MMRLAPIFVAALLAGPASSLTGQEQAADGGLAPLSRFGRGAGGEGFARLVEGEPFPAKLASIDARWNVTLDTASERRVVGAADLICWGGAVESQGEPLLVLADGGVLAVAEIERISGDTLTAWSPVWDEITLPLEVLRGVVLAPPSAAWRRDRLLRMIARREGASDRVLLSSGEELSGVVVQPPAENGNEPAPKLGFRLPAGDAAIALDRIAAIAFNPALAAKQDQPPGAWIGFRDGTLLAVSKVTSKIDNVEVLLAGGTHLAARPEALWGEIVFVQPLGAGATYLSDLPNAGHKQVPYLDLAWPHAVDGNVLGDRLRAAGALWPKGIGMHSDSRLAYDVPPGSRRFQAEAAIDDLAGAVSPTEALMPSNGAARGSVVFRVLMENQQGAWRTAYESPIVRSGDAPAAISVDLAGAARIALIVDRADHGQERDYANWINARFVK